MSACPDCVRETSGTCWRHKLNFGVRVNHPDVRVALLWALSFDNYDEFRAHLRAALKEDT